MFLVCLAKEIDFYSVGYRDLPKVFEMEETMTRSVFCKIREAAPRRVIRGRVQREAGSWRHVYLLG